MSKQFLQEMDRLIRARYPLLYVVTFEEERTRRLLGELAQNQRKVMFEWSITDGLRRVTGATEDTAAAKRVREPLAVLNEISQADTQAYYILKDFHVHLDAPEVVRQLRDLARTLRQTKKTVIIVSPILKLPLELEKQITIVDLPLPTYSELNELLSAKIADPGVVRPFKVNLSGVERDALVKAALGLTLAEAENAFSQAIVRDKVLDGSDVDVIISEKRQIIRKTELLEYCDAADDLGNVGGMDLLKEWLRKRVRAFSEEARRYGLPQPRGILLMGVQGCGKSLVSKTIAASWRLPLLRLDIGRIFQGKFGNSEQNLRRALKLAEGIAPVVLWIDEIDRAFSGSDSSTAADGGATARALASFLTWVQEKTAPVFVIATANEVQGLPPELLRKGRLDEVFFVDLPRARERGEIFQIHLRKVNRDPAKFDMRALAGATKGFSGAEIEQALVSAMHDSFFENREIETADILKSLQETVPLASTMREKVEKLRAWAGGRTRPVSSHQYKATTDND